MKKLNIIWALSCLMACASGPSKMERVSEILGTWEMNTPDGNIYEVWEKVSETEYAGRSFMIAGSDTIPFETVQLLEKDGMLSYIPTVKEQNGGEPVPFKEEKWTDQGVIFANSGHDFPQKISYQWISPDSLVAEISGIQDGKTKSETYAFKRKKS